MINLEKISAFKISSNLSDLVWKIVDKWPQAAKRTIGDQLMRSTDSIPANIAEGEGRYFKKDKAKFFYQARGSVFETIFWIEKAKKRNLLVLEDYSKISQILKELPKEINYLIKNTYSNLIK